MRVRVWIALLALAATSRPAHAEPPAPPADTLHVSVPGVEVTALRGVERVADVPAATFVLSREDMRRAGVPRLSTMLQSLPGLFGYGQMSNGEPQTVDPRGFTASGESSYLKLLVNGQDVRDLENGDVDWDWVVPEDAERVEVVQGPAAWLYGDAGEGGIVNVVRPEPQGRLSSDCALRAGSFGLRTASLLASGSGDAGSGALHGSIRQADGWRYHSQERVYGVGGEARGTLRKRGVGLDVSYLDADRQNPGSLSDDQLAANPEQSETLHDFDHAKRGLLGAHLQSVPGRDPAWTLTGYARGEDNDQIRTLIDQPLSHHTRGWTGGGEYDWHGGTRVAGRPVLLLSTVQAEGSKLTSDYNSFDPDQGVGPLVASGEGWRSEFSTSAGARVAFDTLTVGRVSLRLDLAHVHGHDGFTGTTTSTRTLSAVSPMVAVSHRVGAYGSAYVSASTAFRVPTLYQLYDRRPIFVAPGFSITLSNPDLDPQRSTNVEVGGRLDVPAGGSALLAVYSSWVRDEIDFDLNTLSYANISKSWHRGVEAQCAWPLPRNLTARVAGAWTPTTFRGGDSDGNQINGVPLGTGYASLGWSPVPAGSVDLGARFAARQFLDKAEQNPLAAFATWELGFAAHFAQVHASLRILNLFDDRYADSGFIDAFGQERFFPAASRSVVAALSLD